MLLTKISVNDLLFLMFCLCLALFSINYVVLPPFRLLDIFFLVLFFFFIFLNPKANKTLLVVLLSAIIFFSISTMIGTFKNDSIEYLKLGFIYKYVFIFAVPWVVVSIVKTKKQIKIINWLLLVNFIFLSSWTYIYLSLLASGAINGNFRPSFPLSGDYMYSDAHLYSAYLGFFVVAYLFYLRRFFNHNLVVSFAIAINGIVGMILTGSRTGVFLFGLTILIYGLYNFVKLFCLKNNILNRKKTIIKLVPSLFLILFSIVFFLLYIDSFFSDYERLMQRAFSFDLAVDQSSLLRVQKLMIGIGDASYSGLLLGVGLHSSFVWYDGIFSILIAHGGLLFVLSIFIFYLLIVRKAAIVSTNKKDFLLFLLLVILYFVANLITEYILVSRNAFPVLVMLSVIYVSIVSNKLHFSYQ